jgi:tetratricopeptide (TPR) repeat protein
MPMNEAHTLFQEGVSAIRDEKDAAKGRRLLSQSLRLNPENDMAWLWLTRTTSDPQRQLECLERALSINPANTQAQAFRQKLLTRSQQPVAVQQAPARRTPPINQRELEAQMAEADKRLKDEDVEGAIELWARVLHVQPDHEQALANAVRHLSRLKYLDDAKELVWNAINCGTTHPSVYLTAIDIAGRERRYEDADSLREKLADLPTADDSLIADIVDDLIKHEEFGRAVHMLQRALQRQPDSPKLLLRMGQLNELQGKSRSAYEFYDRASKTGKNSSEGKEAIKKLDKFIPGISDRERASVLLAARETAAFSAFYLFLGWQDAGLNVGRMGGRWLGVLLSTVGGYLLITATSSPQQQPLASLLGGTVPEQPESNELDETGAMKEADAEPTQLPIIPTGLRIVMGAVGAALLVVAFLLVFNTAIGLITNPHPPKFYIPSFQEFMTMIKG